MFTSTRKITPQMSKEEILKNISDLQFHLGDLHEKQILLEKELSHITLSTKITRELLGRLTDKFHEARFEIAPCPPSAD